MSKKLFIEDNIGFVELLEVFGNDITVVNAARVSYHKESGFEQIVEADGSVSGHKVSDRDKKLINFLADHNHVTPFFHPLLRFRIKMPIFIAREWYRHVVGFARNEVSRRYVTDLPECFIPKNLRQRAPNVKQGSKVETIANNDQVRQTMQEFCKQALEYYNKLMETEQVCPEQARMILPQSMYTEFIETASLAAYARLVVLRLEAGAQKEIRDYASLISTLVAPQFPASWQALIKQTQPIQEPHIATNP